MKDSYSSSYSVELMLKNPIDPMPLVTLTLRSSPPMVNVKIPSYSSGTIKVKLLLGLLTFIGFAMTIGFKETS